MVEKYFEGVFHQLKIQYICISFCVHVFRVGAVSNACYWRFSFKLHQHSTYKIEC